MTDREIIDMLAKQNKKLYKLTERLSTQNGILLQLAEMLASKQNTLINYNINGNYGVIGNGCISTTKPDLHNDVSNALIEQNRRQMEQINGLIGLLGNNDL